MTGEDITQPQDETPVNPIDASKATQMATKYLEGIYGNLNFLMFRIEDVRMNGSNDRYLVICSLLTNVGGPRRYYFIKVDVANGNILKISKGIRDTDSGAINWIEENLPSGE